MKRKVVFKAKGNSGRTAKITVELDNPKGQLTRSQVNTRLEEYIAGIHDFLVNRRLFGVKQVKVAR